MKTSQGELKEHYVKTGEATYPNVVSRLPMCGNGEAFSLTEELRLQLVLLPSAGLTGQFYIPTCAPCNQHSGGWEGSPSEHSADLSARLNLLPIHFFPSPWYLLQGKPSVLQHFYLSLGKQMKQRLWCLWTDVVKQSKLPTAYKPSPDCLDS